MDINTTQNKSEFGFNDKASFDELIEMLRITNRLEEMPTPPNFNKESKKH